MNYCIMIDNGFVSGIASSENPLPNPVTEAKKNEVFALLCNKPTAPEGYIYKLRADTLEWELVELPTEPETEPTEEDKAAAYDIIVSGITEKETPKPLEIAKKIKEIVDKYYKG